MVRELALVALTASWAMACSSSNDGAPRGAGGGGSATRSAGGRATSPAGEAPPYGSPGVTTPTIEPIDAPPTYLGTVEAGADCERVYQTRGLAPVGEPSARYPLFLYFVGTSFSATDASARYDSAAPTAVTEAMARRGMVALAVEYDNSVAAWLDPTHDSQLRCLFDAARPDSLVAAACGLPNVDCAQGIAAWGHSQGAFVAHAAHGYDPRVLAVWTTGYGGNPRATLPPERLRVVNGEADFPPNNTAQGMNATTGLGPQSCAEGATECLRPNGSGWILVLRSELASPDATADHCWFEKRACADATVELEPSWVDPDSTKRFALEPNADWLATTLRAP